MTLAPVPGQNPFSIDTNPWSSVRPGDLLGVPSYPRELPADFPTPTDGGGFLEGLGHVARIAASVADIIRAQKGLPAGPYMYGPGMYRFGGEGLGRFFADGGYGRRRDYSPDFESTSRGLAEAPLAGGPKVVGKDITNYAKTKESEAEELQKRLAEVLPRYQAKAFEKVPGYITGAYKGESLY